MAPLRGPAPCVAVKLPVSMSTAMAVGLVCSGEMKSPQRGTRAFTLG
jgi:hypothetical protein